MFPTLRTAARTLRRAFSHVQLFTIFVLCIGIWLAYMAGYYISGSIHAASRWLGATLACMSVIVVLQKSGYRESLQAGLSRVFGTLAGAIIAYIYLICFPFTAVGMLASVFLLEVIIMLLGIYDNGHIATVTMIIIMLVSQQSPDADPAVNCMLRFCESAVGVGIGVGLLWTLEKWGELRASVARRRHERRERRDKRTA